MDRNSVGRIVVRILFLGTLVGFPSSYAFASCSSVLSGTTATVTCTSATDQVIVSQFFGAWYHAGTSTFGVDQFDWDTTTVGEQVLVAGVGQTINFAALAGGNLIVGDTASAPADGLVGTVKVTNSGSASAQVTLDSTISTTPNVYNVNDGFGPTTVNSLTFNAHSTIGEGLTIITGTAADTVNVLTMYHTDNITIQGNSGADVVKIGNAGSVQQVAGPVTVKNTAAFTALTIDDSADVVSRIGTITTGSISGVAPAAINWVANDISGVTLNMGTGNDSLDVLATTASVPVSIQGTSGVDHVNIGGAGSVQAIAGPLSIANTASFTNVLIDDSMDSAARTATYTSTGVTGVAPAAINWQETDILDVTLNMGTGADTVNVLSSGAISALTIQGTGGVDQVNLGNAGNVQSILGSVHVQNTASFSTVVVDDSADTTGRVAHYTSAGVTGVNPGGITWVGNDVQLIAVNLGSGADILHFQGSVSNITNSINLGTGDNSTFVSGSGLGSSSTNSITGGSGDDVFTISAVSTDVTSLNIFGGSQAVADKILYTSGTASGAFPGDGTLLPTDPAAHSINYNSIELFSINDTIFVDDFN